MAKAPTKSRFEVKLFSPAKASAWAFLILPKTASDGLPRRGRTTVEGTINGAPFEATLEPDGKLSHWLKVETKLLTASGAKVGDKVKVEISAVKLEPEPKLPADLIKALTAAPEAKVVWDDTTTIARLDWIHWIESAKQSATRDRRVSSACDMLASGKRRVCCFDQSGFYSKSLSAPKAAD